MRPNDESLLGQLALRLAKSPEDVATEALAYILSRSEAARRAVQHLAEEWATVALRPIVSFRSQVVGGDAARPDLEAQDVDGVPVVIFEDKFWASLTEGQPATYLRRLADRGGVLCFVVPANRTILLWDELVRRTELAEGCQVELLRDEQELKIGRVDANRTLVLTSWGFLLGKVRTALEAEDNLALIADLRQLEGLARRMETAGFIPFTFSDLTASTPRQIVQLCNVVDAAVGLLAKETFVDLAGLRATGGAGWYGRYLRLHAYGCQLAFHADLWSRYGRSPLWLRVWSPDFKPSETADRALAAHYGREECVEMPYGSKGTGLAVRVPEGLELDAVVSGIARQLADVAAVLAETNHPQSSDALPEEVAPDEQLDESIA